MEIGMVFASGKIALERMNEEIQFLTFCLDDRFYAIRLSQIERVVRSVDATPLPQAPAMVLGVISYHGEIVPLLNTRKRLGCPEKDVRLDDQFIIARTSRRLVALVVDGVRNIIEHTPEEIVSAKKIFHQLEQIEGVIQFDDGLILIHDLNQFLSLNDEQELEQALARHPSHGN